MPKIKDLGINIIPGTMRPPEIGGGGGCRHSVKGCNDTGDPVPTDPQFCSQCNCVSDQCAPYSYRPQFYRQPPMGRRGMQAERAQYMDDTSPSLCDCNPTDPIFCSQCNCVSDVYQVQGQALTPLCPPCVGNTQGTTITPQTPKLTPGTLSRDDIAALRAQLRQALENLDVAEKNLLPKTIEGCDAREKELESELAALKARRAELKKE